MDIFILSKRRHICYNSSVPQKRDESIFDRGGRQIAPAVGPKPGSCVPRDRIGRAACPHAAATAEGQNLGRGTRPACPPSQGTAETHPTPAVHTQQRIGFRGKASNFSERKTEYDGASRGITRRTLFSCFSSRFLEAPATRWDFEGTPLSFCTEVTLLGRIGTIQE